MDGILFSKVESMPESIFDWDDANIAHIARHHVTPDEAEWVILNDPYDLDIQIRDGEVRALQIGTTRFGRILSVVSMVRNGRIRVVTVFPAARWQKSLYLRERGFQSDDQS